MNVNRMIRRALPLAGLALVAAAPVAFSQGQQIFEWSGRVDREVQITMRGNDVTTRQVGNTETGTLPAAQLHAGAAGEWPGGGPDAERSRQRRRH